MKPDPIPTDPGASGSSPAGAKNARRPRAIRGEFVFSRSIRRRSPESSIHRRAGFTLVELLLVLVILGILAALVLPKFSGRTEQARVTATQTQISTFKTALDAFEVDTGGYPRGQDGLQQLITPPADVTGWRGPYLSSDIPLDPWQHPYVYEYPGRINSQGFDIVSMGPDGQPGTADDIMNAGITAK